MNIDHEYALTLAQAAREIPGRPHVGTVVRWAARGIKGFKLETVVVGGRRFTSREAISRFVERLNTQVRLDSPKERAQQISRAAEHLDWRGIK
jgi:hypothetical protein